MYGVGKLAFFSVVQTIMGAMGVDSGKALLELLTISEQVSRIVLSQNASG